MIAGVVRAVAGGLATVLVMAVAGWGLPAFQMAGPRPGARIAALVPEVEATGVLVLLVALPLWPLAWPPRRRDAWHRALAVTARGARAALAAALLRRARVLGAVAVGGTVAWLGATLLDGGPALGDVLRVRVMLLALAVFALGLGAWASTTLGGARAVLAGVVVALGLAALPLAAAPVIGSLGAPPLLVQGVLLGCPWLAVAGVAGLDVLRAEWLYALSPLGSVEAPYPALPLAGAAYAVPGLVMLALAARRLARPPATAS